VDPGLASRSTTPDEGNDVVDTTGARLVLNRSFRRTLEAENKSPRTIEAYTDVVRLLATYARPTATRS